MANLSNISTNYSLSSNLNNNNNQSENPSNIKINIEKYIKNHLAPKYFEGREYSYKSNKWQEEFLDDLEKYCCKNYSNYKFYFWFALYDSKGLSFNSNDKEHFYSKTDAKISLYIKLKNFGLDIGGVAIKNLNLTHKQSINDFKSDLRNQIDKIIEKTFEGRTITPSSVESSKYINYILEDILEYVKSKDNYLYYYIVGTILKKGHNHSICERYINQTSNYGTVYLNYQNDSVQCIIYVFSCL